MEDFLASKNRDTEIDIDWISTQHSSDYRILKEVHKPIVMKLRPHYMKTFVSLETTLSLQKGICKKKPDLTFITEKISTNSINDYLESLIVNNYGWASTHQGSVIDKKLKDIVSSQLLLLEVFLNVKSLNLLILFFSRTKDLNMIDLLQEKRWHKHDECLSTCQASLAEEVQLELVEKIVHKTVVLEVLVVLHQHRVRVVVEPKSPHVLHRDRALVCHEDHPVDP